MSSHAFSIPAPFGPRQARDWFSQVGRTRESTILFVFPQGVDLEPGGAVLLKSVSRTREFFFEEQAARDYLDQLQGVTDLRAARAFADRAADELEAGLGERVATSLRAARFSIEELAANVVQHSERPETGFGAVRAHPAAERFQIAFADRGIGPSSPTGSPATSGSHPARPCCTATARAGLA